MFLILIKKGKLIFWNNKTLKINNVYYYEITKKDAVARQQPTKTRTE